MSFNINVDGDYYIYTRVSTKIQASNEANGFDKQDKTCEYYAEKIHKKSINNINYYSDIGSSYNNKSKLRELNLLADEIKPKSLLLIHDVSRLGRNTLQVLNFLTLLEKKFCFIVSVSDNVCFGKSKLLNKKFYRKIIDAEEKSDIKSDRMIGRISIIKQQGGYVGRSPYGFMIKKVNNRPKLVKNPEEQQIISIIKKLLKTKSIQEIAIMLNRTSSTKRSKHWTVTNIKSINLNRKLIVKKSSSLSENMSNMNI